MTNERRNHKMWKKRLLVLQSIIRLEPFQIIDIPL